MGAANICTSCDAGKGWLANVCYTTCPGTFYLNPPNCTSCNLACVNCNGGVSNQCTSCTSGKYLSAGQYLPCDLTCLTCEG